MPIKVKQNLAATQVLEDENIFVMTEKRAITQDIRPLKVLVLNLMPDKQTTETQILRKLSNTPLQIEVEFLQTATYQATHTDSSYLDEMYTTYDEIKDDYFDGLIITGAPLAFVDYEEVEYWDELAEIMEWSKKHVHCTLYLCWAAFAGLYYHYDIRKIFYDKKISGVYEHQILNKKSPLFRGFDDVFFAPQSREIGIDKNDVLAQPKLELMAEGEVPGVTIVKTVDSRQFYVFCHLEYDSDTLKKEYLRDVDKGLGPEIPENYFPDDDPSKDPVVNWRSAGQLFYTNWINYYVYQTTPYDVTEVKDED